MTDPEPYMLELVDTFTIDTSKHIILKNIVLPEEKVILNKPNTITDTSTILGIPVKILKSLNTSFSNSQVKTILSTQYLIILSKMDKDFFLKVCENYNVTYPKLRINLCDGNYSSYQKQYMMDQLIEKFKKCWDTLYSCSAPVLRSLYSKYYTKIIEHIRINVHYMHDYLFAIVYYNMCNLTHIIGEDDYI
jgi:hypothetical protein